MHLSTKKTIGILVAVAAVAGMVRGGAVLLSDGGGCQAGPDPVPDGAPARTDRSSTGQAALWVVNVDGTGETKVAGLPPERWQGIQRGFGWSPDGTAIGYADPAAGAVIIVAPDGPGIGRRLHGSDVPPGPYVMGRAWSPDARHIAWTSNALEVESPGGVRRVVIPATDDAHLRDPAWSPDGSRIAFGQDGDGGMSVVNIDGTGRRQIVGDDTRNFNKFGYAWSPDSRRIAFEAHGGYYGSWLGIVNADGSGLRRIARHCGAGGPDWSPNGQRIVFSDQYGLRLVDPDGGKLTRIPNSWYGHSPAWSPDGTRIAFLRS